MQSIHFLCGMNHVSQVCISGMLINCEVGHGIEYYNQFLMMCFNHPI